jgi:hypothetical protein
LRHHDVLIDQLVQMDAPALPWPCAADQNLSSRQFDRFRGYQGMPCGQLHFVREGAA